MVRVRSISGLIAALAVLVVTATCTPAACLLPLGAGHQPQQRAGKNCCEEPDRSATPTHRLPHDERCPMCQNSVLIAKNVDHGSSLSASALAIVFFSPVAQFPTLTPLRTAVGNASDRPPPSLAVSLLALHCALLT